MRRRVITTSKILAVAIATTPACTKSEVKAEPAPTVASGAPKPEPTPSAAAPVPLEQQLAMTMPDEARAHPERFRALCDKDGYPLVGNLNQKSPGLEPSQFCAEIRAKKH